MAKKPNWDKYSNLVVYRYATHQPMFDNSKADDVLNPSQEKVEEAVNLMLASGLKTPYLRFLKISGATIAKCVVYTSRKAGKTIGGRILTLDEVIKLYSKK